MGCLIRILFRARLESRLLQRTVDEAVFGIHDGGLRVVTRLLHHASRGLVAGMSQVVEVLHALFTGHVLAQVVEHLTVMLQ